MQNLPDIMNTGVPGIFGKNITVKVRANLMQIVSYRGICMKCQPIFLEKKNAMNWNFCPACNSVGNPCDQMTRCTEFVAIFSSASGRIFQNITSYTWWNFSNKSRVCGKSSSFCWCKRYSAIWSDSREHLENGFRQNHVHCSGSPEWQQKQSSNVLENQTRSQNSAYTTRMSLIFRVLCALFEQIPFGMNRDILKNPTLCRAKNSNKLRVHCQLVAWIPHTGKAVIKLCHENWHICLVYLLSWASSKTCEYLQNQGNLWPNT